MATNEELERVRYIHAELDIAASHGAVAWTIEATIITSMDELFDAFGEPK